MPTGRMLGVVAAAVVLIVAVVAALVLFRPAGETDENWTRHTSNRYGYSLDLPSEMVHTPATEDWPGGYPTGGSPYTDSWDPEEGSFPTVDIIAGPLPDGMSRDEFLSMMDEGTAAICTVEETDEVVVNGSVGRLQRQTCGYNAWEILVFDGDQVYMIYWLGSPAAVTTDRPLFDRMVSSFRFAPD